MQPDKSQSSKQIADERKALEEIKNEAGPNKNDSLIAEEVKYENDTVENQIIQEGENFLVEGMEANLADINKLDEDSLTMIKKLAQYLKRNNKKPADFLEGITETQEITSNEYKVDFHVIQANKFYDLLKDVRLIEENPKRFSEFVRIDEENSDLFDLNEIEKLIDHVSKDI